MNNSNDIIVATYGKNGWKRNNKVSAVVVETQKDAEGVVEALVDIINKFETVTFADFYELVGLPTGYLDHKWGWTSMENAQIRLEANGYSVNLPEPKPI